MPLHVYNDTNEPRQVDLEVQHGPSRSTLLRAQSFLPSKASRPVDTGLLPHGDYVLVATAGQVTREARVAFDEDVSFYRFVVQDEQIAFQSG